MRIAAQERGWFTLDVFTPESAEPRRFGPVAVAPADNVHMTLLRGRVELHHGGRLISRVERKARK